MTLSCMKVRCPSCKGRTRLSAEAFAELRRRPTAGIDHACEHCGLKLPATLAGPVNGPSESAKVPTPAVEAKPIKAIATVQAAVRPPFTPTPTAAAAGAPPFGLLGERNPEPAARVRGETPVASPPPFAAGATESAPAKIGKQTFNEWWKSQPPKKQWTFLACFVVTIGAGLMMIEGDDATAAEAKGGKKAAKVEKKEEATTTKQPTPELPAPMPAVEKTEIAVEEQPAVGIDDAMGLLTQETTGLAGKVETPLAAVWAVEGKGFIVRGAKVWSDLQNAKGSTAKWSIVTRAKRYKVAKVRFHREFPADQLKGLAAKGAKQEMLDLLRNAERSDVAFIETTEAPTASLKIARDPEAIVGAAMEIATPVDPKPTRAGQPMSVKFSRQALKPTMLKEDGSGLSFTLAAGSDAGVATKDGQLAAFVPRRNTTGATAHPIVAAETLAEVVDGK